MVSVYCPLPITHCLLPIVYCPLFTVQYLLPTVYWPVPCMSLAKFKTMLERVFKDFTKDDFTTAFMRWLKRCKKCIQIDNSYLRSLRKYIFSEP